MRAMPGRRFGKRLERFPMLSFDASGADARQFFLAHDVFLSFVAIGPRGADLGGK